MDLGIEGRAAFVAGASAGLGLAVATELAREGCRVAVCSRNEQHLDTARARIREVTGASKDDLLGVACDVTDEGDVARGIQEVVDAFGGLNILVTNAGGPPAGFVDDFDADDWRAALELNLVSTINLCRHALPHLRAAARQDDPLARILMVTSVSAKQPIPNLYLSNTSRAGVQGFMKSLSEELGPEGITVNAILPGYTRTERLGELAKAVEGTTGKDRDAIEQEWAADNALKRLGEPEEFAAAAAFLVSARAGYITGTGMLVDGGRVKHLI